MSHLKKGCLIKKRYEIVKMIGEGGFGCIYKVDDKKDGCVKALKVVELNDATKDSEDKTALGEARILNKLQEIQGVVCLLDYFPYGKYNCLVLPLLFKDLLTLRKDQFHPKTTMLIAQNLVKIIRAVHDMGVIHRDMKLANVMTEVNGMRCRLILIDFGMAVKFQIPKKDATKGTLRIRTPRMDFAFDESTYHAHRLCLGQGGQESEDLEMIGYCLLACRNIYPFAGTPEEMLQQKLDYIADPGSVLPQSSWFLLNVLSCLNNQVYGDVPDYDEILHKIKTNGYHLTARSTFQLKTDDVVGYYIE